MTLFLLTFKHDLTLLLIIHRQKRSLVLIHTTTNDMCFFMVSFYSSLPIELNYFFGPVDRIPTDMSNPLTMSTFFLAERSPVSKSSSSCFCCAFVIKMRIWSSRTLGRLLLDAGEGGPAERRKKQHIWVSVFVDPAASFFKYTKIRISKKLFFFNGSFYLNRQTIVMPGYLCQSLNPGSGFWSSRPYCLECDTS